MSLNHIVRSSPVPRLDIQVKTLNVANSLIGNPVGYDTDGTLVPVYPIATVIPGGTYFQQIIVQTTTADAVPVYTVPAGKYCTIFTANISSTVGGVFRTVNQVRDGQSYQMIGATVAANATSNFSGTGTVASEGDVITVTPRGIADMTWVINLTVFPASGILQPLVLRGLTPGTTTVYTCPEGYNAIFPSTGWNNVGGIVRCSTLAGASTITVSTQLVRNGVSYPLNLASASVSSTAAPTQLTTGPGAMIPGDQLTVTTADTEISAQVFAWVALYPLAAFPIDTTVG